MLTIVAWPDIPRSMDIRIGIRNERRRVNRAERTHENDDKNKTVSNGWEFDDHIAQICEKRNQFSCITSCRLEWVLLFDWDALHLVGICDASSSHALAVTDVVSIDIIVVVAAQHHSHACLGSHRSKYPFSILFIQCCWCWCCCGDFYLWMKMFIRTVCALRSCVRYSPLWFTFFLHSRRNDLLSLFFLCVFVRRIVWLLWPHSIPSFFYVSCCCRRRRRRCCFEFISLALVVVSLCLLHFNGSKWGRNI